MSQQVDVLAYITLNKDRLLGGKQLSLLANNEEEQKLMTQDIAKLLKGDVMRMKNGDYIVVSHK